MPDEPWEAEGLPPRLEWALIACLFVMLYGMVWS